MFDVLQPGGLIYAVLREAIVQITIPATCNAANPINITDRMVCTVPAFGYFMGPCNVSC
jgi:hypothetical protein